ncbi:zinc-binding dehydrogenase [Chloroflexi bacterium TSY]|nr:zinc-binding dehydrogenase [Chloroflexi bacterium TSY]
MKKAIISGEQRAELIDVPDPVPKDDWVVVKIQVTPMCTEYKSFVAGQPSEYLGHEAVGEVVAVAQPGHVQEGDRVVVMPQYPCGTCALCADGDFIHCEQNYDVDAFIGSTEGRATYAQYMVKPSWLLPLIPDGLSYEHASLSLCGLGPSFGAFDRMKLDAFDTVLITGAGPVGLGAVVNASFRGARVIVVESIPYRAKRALALGAEAVVNPGDDDCAEQIRDLTEGMGVGKALDCSGAPQAQRLCVETLRRRGQMAFVGAGGQKLEITDWTDMIMKGLTLHGSWHYNLNRYPTILKVIQDSPVIDQLISHQFPMSQIQQAFETSASRESAKILLKPWE